MAARIEAILARARSTFWTEQAEETLSLAQRAAELAAASGAKDLEAPAIGVWGATYAMRGEEGDLDRAIEVQRSRARDVGARDPAA